MTGAHTVPNTTDLLMENSVPSTLRFDKVAGIYYQNNMFTDQCFRDNVSALFINKDNPCYRLLLEEGCDLTTHDASRSYASTADGGRWYLTVTLHELNVRFLIDTRAEVSVLSREVYKCFSCRVDKSIAGVRPVNTTTGSKLRV